MRFPSIDILRAVAVVLMVMVHFSENLAGVDWVPSGLAAPLFTFLVGVSYHIWVAAQEARGKADDEVSKVSVRRGLFLFVIGFAFNVLVWLPEDTFNWDVLTLVGASLLVLNLVRNLPPVVPALIGVMAFALAPVMRELVDFPEYWTDGYFDPDFSLPDVTIGFLATGYFPLFPWLAFPLAGFLTGSALFSASDGDRPPTGRVAAIGAGLTALATVAVLVRWSSPHSEVASSVLGGWTMFPASVEYATGMLGLTLLLVSLGRRWVDPHAGQLEENRCLAVATTLSKYSLSLYVFHHVVHLWPLWVYGAMMGDEPTAFWRNAMSPWLAMGLGGLCLVVGFCLCRWMERTKRPGIESWMRHLCD